MSPSLRSLLLCLCSLFCWRSLQAQQEDTTKVVNLVVTKAPLLGGGVRECAQEGCFDGGVAAVQALARHYSRDGNMNHTIVIPEADFKSPLTFMSRFFIGVNLMIFRNALGWRTWTLPSYTIRANRLSQLTLEDAQQSNFPGLLSNVIMAPDYQSFYGYIEAIRWDTETRLAIILIGKDERSEWETDSAATALTLTRYVYKRNAQYGCPNTPLDAPPLAVFAQTPFDAWYQQEGPTTDLPPNGVPQNLHECFYPVVVYDFNGKDMSRGDLFWETMLATNESEQPLLLLDVQGVFLPTNATSYVTRHSERMWVASHLRADDKFFQVEIETSMTQGIINVTIVQDSLVDLMSEAKTEAYYEDSTKIRQYARQAYEASLVDEVGARTLAMPGAVAEDGFRFCDVQECEFGNLAADALRWKQGADIAILPSFFFAGLGWSAGEVRYLELNENLQYVGQRCAGVMTGLSIHRALAFSVNSTVFDGYYESQDYLLNKQGLFQVSGMRYSYNYELDGEKILSVDVWDEETKSYQPLERTKLYTFVSGRHLCFTFKGFPPYFTDLLTADGEVPAETVADQSYVDDIKDYLLEFKNDEVYVPRLEGRLRFDPTSIDAMTVIDRNDCTPGTEYWSDSNLECETCPLYSGVTFSKTESSLRGTIYMTETLYDEVDLVNDEPFEVLVQVEMLAVPAFITLDIEPSHPNGNYTYILSPGASIKIGISFDTTERQPGTDTSSLLLDVSSRIPRDGCPSRKVRHNIVVQLTLPSDRNYLEEVVIFGYTSTAVIFCASLYFAVWVWFNRKTPVVLSLQPPFLLTLSLGIMILSTAIVPISIDDGVASQWGCDIACMARPWLLSVGFTVSVSALFTKLWRINKLLNGPGFRRQRVRERDVILPLIIFVVSNISLLVVWTVVDPLKWERRSVEGQLWRTYGKCSLTEGGVGEKVMVTVLALCTTGFLGLGWQAFKARNISTEFSESTYLGIAVFSWMQLSVVGVPVLFLMEDSNVTARYGLVVGLLLAICMSMLLFIFLPILYMSRRSGPKRSAIRVSGLNLSSLEFIGGVHGSFTRGHLNQLRSTSLNLDRDPGQCGVEHPSPVPARVKLAGVLKLNSQSSRSRGSSSQYSRPASSGTDGRELSSGPNNDAEKGEGGADTVSCLPVIDKGGASISTGDESVGTSPTTTIEDSSLPLQLPL